MFGKYFLIIFSLFVVMNGAQASKQNRILEEVVTETQPHALYRLPSEQILDENIEDQYFKEKTKIHKNLADRQLYGLGIDLAIETSCYDFINYLKKGGVPTHQLNIYKVTTNMNKPILKSQILKGTVRIEEPDTDGEEEAS